MHIKNPLSISHSKRITVFEETCCQGQQIEILVVFLEKNKQTPFACFTGNKLL